MLQKSVAQTISLLTPVAAVGIPKARIGGESDGGYVMLDDFPQDLVCYSIGIGGDVTWDKAMADRGAMVFQYDHTVAVPPQEHPSFRFNCLGLGPSDNASDRISSLQSMLISNGHDERSDLILKVDIEGAEWPVFANLNSNTISRFRQIVIELHGLGALARHDYRILFNKTISNLRATHLPVHVHGNNWGCYAIVEGLPIPDVIEVTWANRDAYSFLTNRDVFPTALDRPCHPERPDFYLGTFSFRANS